MSINMELMRKKLAALRGEGTNDSTSVWFKPDEGDTDIRIVPTNDGDPLKEMFFHYNVGDHKGGVLCPKRNYGEECPICEFASSLWRDGVDNNDDESKKLAKSLFVRIPVDIKAYRASHAPLKGGPSSNISFHVTQHLKWFFFIRVNPVHTVS